MSRVEIYLCILEIFLKKTNIYLWSHVIGGSNQTQMISLKQPTLGKLKCIWHQQADIHTNTMHVHAPCAGGTDRFEIYSYTWYWHLRYFEWTRRDYSCVCAHVSMVCTRVHTAVLRVDVYMLPCTV